MKKETIIERLDNEFNWEAVFGKNSESQKIIQDFLFDTIKEVILDFKFSEKEIEKTKKAFGRLGETSGEMLEHFNNYIEEKAKKDGLI